MGFLPAPASMRREQFRDTRMQAGLSLQRLLTAQHGPTSSRETRFTVAAAPAMRCFPTAVEPVKPIFRTESESNMA